MATLTGEETSHAIRHPLQTVQAPRTVTKTKLSDAEKATYNEKRQVQRDNKLALTTDIDAWAAEHGKKIQELAEKYGKSLNYIQDIIDHTSCLKKSRAPNLQNALAHHKAAEVNEGALCLSLPLLFFPHHLFNRQSHW